MRTIGAFEAKTHLSKLLEQVAMGEQIAISKHGKNIALLIPYPEDAQLSTSTAIAAMDALRQKIAATGITLADINAMKTKGRK